MKKTKRVRRRSTSSSREPLEVLVRSRSTSPLCGPLDVPPWPALLRLLDDNELTTVTPKAPLNSEALRFQARRAPAFPEEDLQLIRKRRPLPRPLHLQRAEASEISAATIACQPAAVAEILEQVTQIDLPTSCTGRKNGSSTANGNISDIQSSALEKLTWLVQQQSSRIDALIEQVQQLTAKVEHLQRSVHVQSTNHSLVSEEI